MGTMPSIDVLTPRRRDALLAVVAVALLAAPVWVQPLQLDDERHEYRRIGVTVDNGTVTLTEQRPPYFHAPISEEIACSDRFPHDRRCYFERRIAENGTVPSGILSSNSDSPTRVPADYGYVLANGTTYAVSTTKRLTNSTSEWPARVHLSLEPVPATEALDRVSVPAEDVPPTVRAAATQGTARTPRDVAVPETPVKVGIGEYYRVYEAGTADPSSLSVAIHGLLTLGGPLVGLVLLARLSRRVSVGVTYDPPA